MDWNLLTDQVQPDFDFDFAFPSNTTTSTCLDHQFTPYNFVSTPPFDNTGAYDEWKLMDMSCNLVPTSSDQEPPLFEKGLSELVNGSGCDGTNSLGFEGIPDCNVLGMDQVDDNFMNSLSDEDIRAMLSTVEPSQQVPNPCNKPETFDNILTDLLNDPISDILYPNGTADANNGLDAFGISLLSQDISVNSAASDSSTLINPRGSFAESRELFSEVAKAKILEATILRELEAALSRINERTRICFRDACYRLANDSKGSRGFHFEPFKVDPVEKESNVIDRAIANLLLDPPAF